ncbi:MAG: outer membrane beta-barrel protein [Chitinophagales bacterium]
MKTLTSRILLLAVLIPCSLFSQQNSMGFGLKAGINFSNVVNASQINTSNQAGFNAGFIMAPVSKSVIGSRTELLFSRQGYNYATASTTGAVNLDYIMLAQLMSIRVTKFFEIQVGGQAAYLVSAKAGNSKQYTSNSQINSVIELYNRYDYGFAGGIEFHPIKGLLVGARYNISIPDLYKPPTFAPTDSIPSFIPSSPTINLKNNLFQLYAGFRF